jgi:hypothetical protein
MIWPILPVNSAKSVVLHYEEGEGRHLACARAQITSSLANGRIRRDAPTPLHIGRSGRE